MTDDPPEPMMPVDLPPDVKVVEPVCEEGFTGGGPVDAIAKFSGSCGLAPSSILDMPQRTMFTKRIFQRTDFAGPGDHGALTSISAGVALTEGDGGVQSFQQSTYDTTATPAQSFAVYAMNEAMRVTGSNPLVNVGVYGSARNGQVNYSFYGAYGTLRNNGAALLGTPITVGDGAQATGNKVLLYSDFEVSGSSVTLGNNVSSFTVPGSAAGDPRIGVGTSALPGQLNTKNVASNFSGLSSFADTNVSAAAYAGTRLFRGAIQALRAGITVGSAGQFAGGNTENALVLWSYDATGTSYGIELATGANPDVRVRVQPTGQTDVLAGLRVAGQTKLDGNGHVRVSGTAPALSACGTGATIAGSDVAATVTTGTAGAGCTITFAVPYTAAPICTVTARGGVATAYTTTTSALILTTTAPGAMYDYHCFER
jgi:hypothetical protein